MPYKPLDPLAYLDGLDKRTERPASTGTTDPLADAISDYRAMQQGKRVVADVWSSPPPDTVAKVQRTARKMGVSPLLIENDPDGAEQSFNLSALTETMRQFPVFGKFFGDNPRAAVMAQDDAKSLRGIMQSITSPAAVSSNWQSFRGSLNKVPQELVGVGGPTALGMLNDTAQSVLDVSAGVNSLVTTPLNMALDPLYRAWGIDTQANDRWLAKRREAQKTASRAYFKDMAEGNRPTYSGPTEESVLRGLDSTVSSLMAIATRNPNAAAAAFGVGAGASSYQDAKASGMNTPDAIRYGMQQGIPEAVFERGPSSALIDALVKRLPTGQTFAKFMAEELPGEMATTFVQSYSDWQMKNPSMGADEWVATLPGDMQRTVLGVLGGGTAQVVLAKTAERSMGVAGKVVGRVAEAQAAKADATKIDGIAKGVEGSTLRTRDPETFREMMKAALDENGTEHVYLPGEAAVAYFQSDAYDPATDPMAEFYHEAFDAAASGGDVVLPADFALSVLPGTPAWEAVRGDLRLTSGGMSANEADSLDIDAMMAEVGERFDKIEAAQREANDARATLTEKITAKLNNAGYTPYMARAQAELIAQRTATRAARRGEALTGNEFDTVEVNQVLPPELARAKAADGTDLVINALRKGKDAEAFDGPSLLEWIAKRGGINDTGGDLKSMGLDKWHRGKIGRKKLLRKFDAAQGAFGGVSGAGDYGVDSTLRAAIEAGYFPDLVGVEGESGPSSLDTQALLDAMADENAGRPRYAGEARIDNMRAAAEELRGLLADRGLDPDGMSDAELRDVVRQLDEASAGGYEQLPDTLDIDGVARPTRNSEGQPIAGSEEGVRNFYAWFSDSKVVDEEGRPLVVYHGTRSEFEAFGRIDGGNAYGDGHYFTRDPATASNYATGENVNRVTLAGDAGPSVMPVYLAISEPFIARERLDREQVEAIEEADNALEPGRWSDGELWSMFDYAYPPIGDNVLQETGADDKNAMLRDAGFDGLETPYGLVAFSPTQIKSINNRGTFDPADARILYQVTPQQALDTNVAVEMPSDPLFAEAVENTAGAQVTADGLLIDVVRVQKPEQDGARSVRTGVFYLPKGSSNLKHYRRAGSSYGGSEKHEGETLVRRPLFVKGATGGKAPEAAYEAVKGKGALKKLETEIFRVIGGQQALKRDGLFEEAIYNFLEEHNADGDLAYEIIANSKQGNQLRYALQENVIAHAVRDAGYDAVVGYSKGKAGASISEVFDVREQTYPAMGYESDIHPAFGGRSYFQPAYHGSPHIFDKFSLSAIGTGEGAQAYGWGLYFAGRKEIAEHYRNTLTLNIGFDYGGRTGLNRADVQNLANMKYGGRYFDNIARASGVADKVMDDLIYGGGNKYPDGSERRAIYDEIAAELKRPDNAGRTYTVEIPEDDEYLLWDRPLSEQPEKVRAAIEKLKGGDKPAEELSNDELFAALGGFEQTLGDKEKTGQGFYKELSADLAAKAGRKDADEGNGWTVVNPTVHYMDASASKLLHDLGIAGIKYLDGTSRSDGEGSYNYVVFDENRVSIQAYEQSYGDGPRGRIQFNTGRTTIDLFQARNNSTLIHELSHLWLEELRIDAETPGAPEQLQQDWQTVQDWFAANNQPLTDGIIPVEAHELFARAGERYVMEGKAPSPALTRLFETFRGWMVSIYKTVTALRAPITPEIRSVFDRLVATDEELNAMAERQALEPLFKDAASIGMSEQEFAAYSSEVDNARTNAASGLLTKTMASVKARVTKEMNDQRRTLEAEASDALDQTPLYRALRALKSSPVNAQWIRDEMGADALDLLPRRVPPVYSDKGAHPDAIAEMAGYGSGREMIDALIGAELTHRQAKEGGDQRTMRAREIAGMVDEEMHRRHGDPFTDGSIEREALEAVHNDKQGEVFAAEARALARKTGQRVTPYRVARDWARRRVREGTYAAEASPAAIQRHARNAAKAGTAAEKAMLAGKFDEALLAKQQQMLASAQLSEAKQANDEVEAARKRMDKIARRATSKSVDQDYLDQAHALLEAVDLRERSQKLLSRAGSWEEWSNARAAEGFDIVVPPSFEALIGKTNWSRLPVEQLLGLDAAVAQVMHLGRLKQTLLDNQERRDFEELVQEARAGAGNIDGPPPQDLMEPGWFDAVKAKVAATDAALLKMETIFDWLDGGNSNGVFNRIAFRPIADAQGREQDMLKDYYGRIKALFEAVPGEITARWGDTVTLPFTNRETGRPERFRRQQLIAIALNTGNEGNLQRLTDGHGWNADALIEALNAELTGEEWALVQGVWDVIETLWPEIEGMEKRVNGLAPEKVEAREVVTPFGTFRGGYYPAIYDSTRNYRAEENRGKESDLFEGGYTRATTRASATKNRLDKVTAPILLDLGVINRHLGEVIHDVTHREAVMQANKFLTNERIMRVVDEALGPEIRKQFRPWVKFVANSWAIERAGNEGFGKWLGKLRANVTAVGMGLRATTVVTQIAGYSNSIEVVGEKWVAPHLKDAVNPRAYTFVLEKSPEVRNRMDTLDRDIRTELARLSAANPASKAARMVLDGRKFFFHGIGYMDRAVVVPTWLGAYDKALAGGMDEQDAIYAADKAVRVSQGAGAPKDMAAIVRGTGKWGEALKLMTMFYSYFSAMYQRERTLGRDVVGNDQRRPRNVPRLAARAFWLMIVPPLLTEVLKAGLGGGDAPDDEEWWAQWVMRKMLANALGPIPMARDVFEPAWNAARGGQAFTPAFSPVNRALSSFVDAARDVGKITRGEETTKATKHILETAGYATGLIPGQVASAAQFLVDVGAGDADPEGFADWVQGLSTGKIKDD